MSRIYSQNFNAWKNIGELSVTSEKYVTFLHYIVANVVHLFPILLPPPHPHPLC